MAHAAQVARSLFTHGANEVDRPLGDHARLGEGTRHGEHHREPAAVVADAGCGEPRTAPLHPHVRPLGEHGVEMPGDDDRWPRRDAGTLGDHVPLGVRPHALEAEGREPATKLGGAAGLLEWRRGDLADGSLLRERPRVVRADAVERGAHARVVAGRALALRGSAERGEGNEREGERGAEEHDGWEQKVAGTVAVGVNLQVAHGGRKHDGARRRTAAGVTSRTPSRRPRG